MTEEARFEDQLAKLEEIVTALEDETVGLEESLDLFERGMQLAKSCRARLEAVEQRVERLLEETGTDGEPRTEPVNAETE